MKTLLNKLIFQSSTLGQDKNRKTNTKPIKPVKWKSNSCIQTDKSICKKISHTKTQTHSNRLEFHEVLLYHRSVAGMRSSDPPPSFSPSVPWWTAPSSVCSWGGVCTPVSRYRPSSVSPRPVCPASPASTCTAPTLWRKMCILLETHWNS